MVVVVVVVDETYLFVVVCFEYLERDYEGFVVSGLVSLSVVGLLGSLAWPD